MCFKCDYENIEEVYEHDSFLNSGDVEFDAMNFVTMDSLARMQMNPNALSLAENQMLGRMGGHLTFIYLRRLIALGCLKRVGKNEYKLIVN